MQTPTAHDLFMAFWSARFLNPSKNPTPPGAEGFEGAANIWLEVWEDCALVASKIATESNGAKSIRAAQDAMAGYVPLKSSKP